MMHKQVIQVAIVFAACCYGPILATAQGQDAEQSVAIQAYGILKERCYRCHGGAARQAGLDVLSRESLLEPRGDESALHHFVIPGDPEKSTLIDAIKNGKDSYMPDAGSPEAELMTDSEKELLRDWVKQGAPFPMRRDLQVVSDKQVMRAVRDYLFSLGVADRRFTRFYSLAQLNNNPDVTAMDLRLYRAALSKAINSLSKQTAIHLPVIVPDTNGSVLAIDLRLLGWNQRNLWERIVGQYPYGLSFSHVKDEELQAMYNEVVEISGTTLPILRADWFVVTATRPPLYHELLEIPVTLSDLERQLELNLIKNFTNGDLHRSGYAKSGVSRQNRMLERHASEVTPYFWISYDFLPGQARGDLVRFPLGPLFKGNPFAKHAFDHDGGEVIWSLPNGLQAYMLVSGTGDRIDAGPVEVVFDRNAVLGTPSIINGISCIYCHRHGMIKNFSDEIRNADAVAGDVQEKVKQLYPLNADMQKLIARDESLFLKSLEDVVGAFLKVEEDSQREITSFPEPVAKVAEMYFRDLTALEVSLELGISDPHQLKTMIGANPELLRFGMGTLAQEPPGTLKRDKWEARDGTSLMQDVASELRIGTPLLP